MIKTALAIITLNFIGYSQTTDTISNYLLMHQNILEFADYLFCEKDYLRSANEYLRIDEKAREEKINFKLALSLSAIGDHYSAKNVYERIEENSIYFQPSRLEILKIFFLEENYSELRNYAVSERSLNLFDNNTSARKIYFLSYLKDQDTVPALQDFIKQFDIIERKDIETLYKSRVNSSDKNPLLAAGLSAVIPGAGKIYTGDIGDGIFAFLLTGLYAFISYDNFRADHDFRGWLFSSLAVLFYTSNVYGSYAAAQIHNARQKYEFNLSLDSFLNLKNYFMPDYDFCK